MRQKYASCPEKSRMCAWPSSTCMSLGFSFRVRIGGIWSLTGWIMMVSVCRIKVFLRTAKLIQGAWSSPLAKQSRGTCSHSLIYSIQKICLRCWAYNDKQGRCGSCHFGACNLERRDPPQKKNLNVVTAKEQTEQWSDSYLILCGFGYACSVSLCLF